MIEAESVHIESKSFTEDGDSIELPVLDISAVVSPGHEIPIGTGLILKLPEGKKASLELSDHLKAKGFVSNPMGRISGNDIDSKTGHICMTVKNTTDESIEIRRGEPLVTVTLE